MHWTPRTFRWALNLYPAYFFSRTYISFVGPDWKHITVKLKKSWLNRNYVGTVFGGTLYSAGDPFHMLMLMQILDIKKYIVWDKAATIEFIKPGRSTITYNFKISDQDLETIYEQTTVHGKFTPEFIVEGIDEGGDVCVRIKKTLYVRRK
jgi:hypothetical protein